MTEGDYDYGEGKTREQETADSVQALGIALLVSFVVIAAGLVGVTWWALA